PLSGQTAPREQLARRQSIPPRRRRYLPPPIVALAHDPALLFQRPTTPGTSLDHLKSRHLRHSRMISHTPMSSPPHPSHKAVLSAGIRLFWTNLRFCGQTQRQTALRSIYALVSTRRNGSLWAVLCC